MTRFRIILLLAGTLLAAAVLTVLLNLSVEAQDNCQVQPNGVQVCIINGRWCIVNSDGSQVCRTGPPFSSPVAPESVQRLYLPVVEK